MGVKAVIDPVDIQLGRIHDGGDGGIHLQHRPQLLSGEIHVHQGEAGGAVLPHPHGQHIEGHRGGDVPRRDGGAQHPVGGDGDGGAVIGVGLQLLRRPLEGVGHQSADGVVLLHAAGGSAHGEVRVGQHLVIGQAVPGQIAGVHLGLPALHDLGDARVAGQLLVDGGQVVVHKGLFAVPEHAGQGDGAQIAAVRPAGNDIGIVHHDGLRQGGVGVAGDDHVDAGHLLGQLLVLRLLLLVAGAGVGQADDDLGPLLLQGVYAPLGAGRRVLQNKAGGGGAVVGVLTKDAEDAVGHTAPLQQGVVRHAVGSHGPLDVQLIRVVVRRPVVGAYQLR